MTPFAIFQLVFFSASESFRFHVARITEIEKQQNLDIFIESFFERKQTEIAAN